MRLLWGKRPRIEPPIILGTYTSPAFWQRHRRKVIFSLIALSVLYGAAFGLTTTFFLLQLTVPLIIFAGATIWMLPDSETAPLGLLSKLLTTFIVALLVWPDYLALTLPGLPWITAVRLVGVPLAFVLFVCLSTSEQLRAEMAETLRATPTIWRLLVAFAILCVVSVPVSTDIGFSLSKLVVAGTTWFLIFFVAAWVFREPGRLTRFAYLIWAITILVSLIGLQEHRHSVVPWAGNIPSFLTIQDENVQRILSGAARAATGIYRVQSKFTTSLGLAEFYSFAIPFVVHFAFKARFLVVRLIATTTIPFLFYMIILTDSRLGMVGFFFSLLFYTLAWSITRWTRDRESLFGPALTLSFPALFCSFLAASFFVGRLRQLIWGTGAQQASTDSRKVQVAMGWPKISQRPWGYGIGRAGDSLGFQNGAGVTTIDTYYLSVALEFGVVGFFVYYLLFINATWNAARRIVRARTAEEQLIGPLAIAFVNFLVIKSIFSQQENHPLIFAMLGAIVALCWRIDKAEAEEVKSVVRDDNSLVTGYA